MYPNPSFLVVDDKVEILELLIPLLVRVFEGKCDVYTANSGQEALRIAKEFMVDHALLDIQMPGMNGIETVRELKRINPGIRAVMMTGGAPEEMIQEAIQAGAIECLMKPVDVNQLKKIMCKSEDVRY